MLLRFGVKKELAIHRYIAMNRPVFTGLVFKSMERMAHNCYFRAFLIYSYTHGLA
jgi:hypothetical protein